MDAGNILYFGIIAVVVIINIAKLVKKSSNKTQSIPTNPSPAMPDPWREIMQELQGEVIPQEIKEVNTEINPQDNQSQESIEKDEINYYQEIETQEQTANKKTNSAFNIKDKEITESQQFELKPNDLRKAVIYSEILNRKYT